jgi:hypothetical protein
MFSAPGASQGLGAPPQDVFGMADIPDDFDEAKMTKLAREEVMNIRKWPDVLEDYDITEDQFYEISKVPHYQRAKAAYAIEWNATLATGDRVKTIAAVLLERGMRIIDRRMHDPGEPFNSVIEAHKLLARSAGIGEAKGGEQKNAERFVITINLGDDDTKTYDKSLAVSAAAVEVIEPPREPAATPERKPGRPRKHG